MSFRIRPKFNINCNTVAYRDFGLVSLYLVYTNVEFVVVMATQNKDVQNIWLWLTDPEICDHGHCGHQWK